MKKGNIMGDMTIKGLKEFKEFITSIEHDVNYAIKDIFKKIQVPRQVELHDIRIPLINMKKAGNLPNSYIMGHAKISIHLNID